MLWTLLISLILYRQFGCKPESPDLPVDLEHTPGFYQLEALRLNKLPLAMERKLLSAKQKYAKSKQYMDKFANKTPSMAKTNAFFKLCSADKKVIQSKRKLDSAIDDAISALKKSNNANRYTNEAYELAYTSKIELLKQGFSRFCSR